MRLCLDEVAIAAAELSKVRYLGALRGRAVALGAMERFEIAIQPPSLLTPIDIPPPSVMLDKSAVVSKHRHDGIIDKIS